MYVCMYIYIYICIYVTFKAMREMLRVRCCTPFSAACGTMAPTAPKDDLGSVEPLGPSSLPLVGSTGQGFLCKGSRLLGQLLNFSK